METEFDIPIAKLHEIVYENNSLNQRIHISRGTHDFQVGEWEEYDAHGTHQDLQKLLTTTVGSVDMSKLPIKYRSLTYTVQLNNPLVKSAFTKEKQYLLQYEPDRTFVVLSQARNEGVPFSDYFVVNATWCFMAGDNPERTRVRVHFNITFVKSSWSFNMLKSNIEKSSIQGITDYANDFQKQLLVFIQENATASIGRSLANHHHQDSDNEDGESSAALQKLHFKRSISQVSTTTDELPPANLATLPEGVRHRTNHIHASSSSAYRPSNFRPKSRSLSNGNATLAVADQRSHSTDAMHHSPSVAGHSHSLFSSLGHTFLDTYVIKFLFLVIVLLIIIDVTVLFRVYYLESKLTALDKYITLMNRLEPPPSPPTTAAATASMITPTLHEEQS